MLYVTQNKLRFGRTIISDNRAWKRNIFSFIYGSYTVVINFDQQFSFEYFYNCSDHKVISRSVFRLTGMNVLKKRALAYKWNVCGRDGWTSSAAN